MICDKFKVVRIVKMKKDLSYEAPLNMNSDQVDPRREESGMPELFLNCKQIRLRAWHLPNTKIKTAKGLFTNFFVFNKN